MDYETGAATDPDDLLDKLATFAGLNGWTVSTVASGLVFRKSTVVVGAAGDASNVYLRGAITYNGAADWNAQTNNSGLDVVINTGAGPFTAYHFFAGDEDGMEYLNIAVEISSGLYRHFCMGQLIKSGSYTGGTYVDGTWWDLASANQNFPYSNTHQTICDSNSVSLQRGHVWCDFDSKTNNWQNIAHGNDFNTAKGIGTHRNGGIDCLFDSLGYMRWNLRNLMCPLHYYVNRASDLRSVIGRIPNMRSVGMYNLLAGETITIGGDDWLIFPVIARATSYNSLSGPPSSGILGYAYKMP